MQRKNGRRKKIAYVLCGILAVVLFSGCQSTAADGTDEKVFVYGDTTFNAENDESDVNPHNGYSGWACIRYGIGETLFHYSDSMEIEPWLAESYELVDDTTASWNSMRGCFLLAQKHCATHISWMTLSRRKQNGRTSRKTGMCCIFSHSPSAPDCLQNCRKANREFPAACFPLRTAPRA